MIGGGGVASGIILGDGNNIGKLVSAVFVIYSLHAGKAHCLNEVLTGTVCMLENLASFVQNALDANI